jgi:predicted DNA-binding transcriptional regulator YafY
MGIFNVFKRKKPRDIEAERRAFLHAHGRITDGMIVDSETGPRGGEIVFYRYTLNGVDFESSEIISAEQMRDPLKYAPGSKIGVLYDPKNQGNSMLQ